MTESTRPTPSSSRRLARSFRRAWHSTFLTAIVGISLAALTGCGPLGLERSESAAPKSGEVDNTVAAVIDGKNISVSDVDTFMQEEFIEELYSKPPNELYEAREKAIRNMVQEQIVDAEAASRGLSKEGLFEELVAEVAPPTDEDIASWYAENQPRLRGAQLDQVSDQIRQLLSRESQTQVVTEFMKARLDDLDFEFVLAPPRQDLEATRLVRGKTDAPVTLVTFSDYQCPYCIRAEPVLAEVLQRYPEDVRVIHRHFPLDSIHPFARPASEAAMCADEQGKFWAFHDAIFARSGQLSENSFAEIGSEVGLDTGALATCIDERRYQDFVDKDFEAGRTAGVTGTPAFFVNGILLKGARTADQLSAVIDSELERATN